MSDTNQSPQGAAYLRRLEILTEISDERARQASKPEDANRTPFCFEYTLDEADLLRPREELIRLGAHIVAAIECIDNKAKT